MNNVKIQVNPNKSKFDLCKEMYGIFYEEINHSGDGGLYAELVQNRNFCDAIVPEGSVYYNEKVKTAAGHREKHSLADELPAWSLKVGEGALGKIEPWIKDPRNESIPNQLKLTARNIEEGRVWLKNSGYWGMAIEKEAYRLTVIVRSENVNSLKAAIITPEGKEIASGNVKGIHSAYEKFTLKLHSTEKVNKCILALSPEGDGELYFDFVSLFPINTFKKRENGMNRHIAQMIANLKPGFMRFPGGCIVEGISLENAFTFKQTLGPIEDRSGCWNLWGYRRTDGIGYHEYLQFCEDLGAKAMYVFNCGMSCQARNSQLANKKQMDYFLQDAMDAIDYAIAPVTNKWGALRAKNGHPEPFELKYLEIGNENSGPHYEERYKYFYKKLKEKYPDLIYISNTSDLKAKEPYTFDLVDQHYYVTPDMFPAMDKKYDNYDRNSYQVYVGEYAANKEVGIGNIAAAASEASFMINMERNGDIVKLASYAPLLCHMQDRKWPVNLICFEDDVVFGIPSYHVQKLFNQHLAKTIIETEVQVESFAKEAKVHAVGGIADNNDIIIKAVNFSYKSSNVEIDIQGEYKIEKVYEIAGANPKESNDITHPDKISVKEIIVYEPLIMKPYGVYVIRYTI